jgi:Flp pilus assembly protein TadB
MENLRIFVVYFFLALLAILVLAIAGMLIYDAWDRRRIDRKIWKNETQHQAERILANRSAEANEWYDEDTKFGKGDRK